MSRSERIAAVKAHAVAEGALLERLKPLPAREQIRELLDAKGSMYCGEIADKLNLPIDLVHQIVMKEYGAA